MGHLAHLPSYRSCVGPNGHVVGIDFSAPTVERARWVLTMLGVENVEVVIADLNALDTSVFAGPFDPHTAERF